MIRKSILTLLTTAMIASPLANAAQAGDFYDDQYLLNNQWNDDEWDNDNLYEKRSRQDTRHVKQKRNKERRRGEEWLNGDRELRREARRAENQRIEQRRLAEQRRAEQQRKRHKKKDRNTAIALGVLGIIAGAAIIGSIDNNKPQYRTQPQRRRYTDAQSRSAPKVVYSTQYQPWSQGWYAHCSAKYRSFNPNTGMYLGYDGKHHMCK